MGSVGHRTNQKIVDIAPCREGLESHVIGCSQKRQALLTHRLHLGERPLYANVLVSYEDNGVVDVSECE